MNWPARWLIPFFTLVLLLAPSGLAHGNDLRSAPPVPFETIRAPPTSEPDAVADAPSKLSDDAGYEIRFKCPVVANPNSPDRNNTNFRCPADIVDPEDIMSNPVLVIDPADPTLMAFNALHGGRGLDSSPTNRSRNNHIHQPHTTFITTDGRYEVWQDNPYYSPLAPPKDRTNPENDPMAFFYLPQLKGPRVFGEDNAAAVDAQGRLYLSSLYAFQGESNESAYQYAFGWWKAQRLNRPPEYYTGVKLWKAPAAVSIDSAYLVYVPGSDRVAALWRETNASAAQKSYINLAWTVPGKGAVWYFLKERDRIGPCSAITNPLAYQGLIYVGCFADQGYTDGEGAAAVGRLQIHAIDARRDAWTSTWVDETTLSRTPQSANAILVDRTDGRMALVTAGIAVDGRAPFLKVTNGEFGTAWDDPADYSAHLRGIGRTPGATIVDARITAAAFVLRSGNLHFIYKERYKFDEDRPTEAPEFYKALISVFTGAQQFNKLLPLGVDTEGAAAGGAGLCQLYDFRWKGYGKDVFDDFHDGLVIWQNKQRHQREFVAYGDCGNVRFAEVFEENFIAFSFPAPPGTPAIPASVPNINPAQVGIVAGVLAGAMVLRMLAFRRKLAVEAPA